MYKTESPNLLFIFPDQYRQSALGIWSQPEYAKQLAVKGDPVHTPNLDRLAQQGVLFNQAYSICPICSPYRAMLMSSMYPAHNGVGTLNCRDDRSVGLRNDIICFTDVLSAAGYDTAYMGKTHWARTEPLFDRDGNYVGKDKEPGGFYANPYDTYIPPGRGRLGNRVWFQQISDNHKNPKAYSSVPDWVGGKPDGSIHLSQRYSPERESEVVIDYLNNRNSVRDTSKPFSIFWAPNPPHNDYSKVSDTDESVYRQYYQGKGQKELLLHPNVKPVSDGDLDTLAPVYFSHVTAIDREIGKVLAALAKSGEADNTIVIFTADHGDMMGSQGMTGKTVMYPEAFMVPFIIKYPDRLGPRIEDLRLSPVDVMPTVLGLLGLAADIPKTAEGVNYAPALLNSDFSATPKPAASLYLFDKAKGIRTARYAYQVDDKGGTQLFDLSKDPYCLTSLDPKSIPPKDFEFLRTELGRQLRRADDPWLKKQQNPEWIAY